MGQGVRRDRSRAFPDKQLKPGAAVFGCGERHPAGRQYGDVAAVAALIEDAELAALSGAEIEGMLDDSTEARGLHRNPIVALIAQQRSIALIGVVVLVVREPLSGPQIALLDATGIAVGRAHAGQRRAAPIATDILDQEIARS